MKALTAKSAPSAIGIQARIEASGPRLAGRTSIRAKLDATITTRKTRNRGIDRFIVQPPYLKQPMTAVIDAPATTANAPMLAAQITAVGGVTGTAHEPPHTTRIMLAATASTPSTAMRHCDGLLAAAAADDSDPSPTKSAPGSSSAEYTSTPSR